MGYNHATIIYDTQKATVKANYGSYQNANSGNGGSTGGNSGGSTAPASSVCGAKNKTGGYCKRVVSGRGRCWPHR